MNYVVWIGFVTFVTLLFVLPLIEHDCDCDLCRPCDCRDCRS